MLLKSLPNNRHVHRIRIDLQSYILYIYICMCVCDDVYFCINVKFIKIGYFSHSVYGCVTVTA